MIDQAYAKIVYGRVASFKHDVAIVRSPVTNRAFTVRNADNLTTDEIYSPDLIGIYNNTTSPNTILEDWNDNELESQSL